MNVFIGMGRLVRDPEYKIGSSGKGYSTFTIAINRYNKQADFINCIAFDKTADLICGHFRKGSGIAIEGQLNIDTSEGDDGTKRSYTKIVIQKVNFPPAQRFEDEGRQDYQQVEGYAPRSNSDEDVPF